MARVCESNIFFVRSSSVHLSVTLSPPKPLGGIQPNLLHHFPSLLGCFESNIIFPCVRRPSICSSRYLLLNHWAECNQTCYITSPHGWGVRDNIIFPCVRSCVSRPSTCLLRYLLLNHWAEFNQTCYITSPHGKGCAREQLFSVRPTSVHLSVMLSPPKPLGGIQPNLLYHS